MVEMLQLYATTACSVSVLFMAITLRRCVGYTDATAKRTDKRRDNA